MITYADDNYFGESDEEAEVAIRRITARMENAIRWLTMSGLKINTLKTEFCIFHRKNVLTKQIDLMGLVVKTGTTINVLGIKFDSKLKWNEYVDMAIKGANASLMELELLESISQWMKPET